MGREKYILLTTATGFEPVRAKPIGFQVQLLNLSDTLSLPYARSAIFCVSAGKPSTWLEK